MRRLILFPLAVIVPLGTFLILETVTEDAASAIILGLLLLITIGAWFAGPEMAGGRRPIGG